MAESKKWYLDTLRASFIELSSNEFCEAVSQEMLLRQAKKFCGPDVYARHREELRAEASAIMLKVQEASKKS